MDKLLEEIKSLGEIQKFGSKVVFCLSVFCILIFRLVQYLSRAIYDSLQQSNISSDLVEKLKSFEYILSSFRKCYYFHSEINSIINHFLFQCYD